MSLNVVDIGKCRFVLDSLVATLLPCFSVDASERSEELHIHSLRVRVLNDISAFYGCGETGDYLKTSDSQPTAALIIYHLLEYLGASTARRGRASDIEIQELIFKTIAVVLENIGTSSCSMCFPGISSFVARSISGSASSSQSSGSANVSKFCRSFVPILLQYLCFEWDCTIWDASKDFKRYQHTTDKLFKSDAMIELTIHQPVTPELIARLAPDLSLSGVGLVKGLLSLYLLGLWSSIEATDQCDGDWLTTVWPRLSGHLVLVLQLKLVSVLLCCKGADGAVGQHNTMNDLLTKVIVTLLNSKVVNAEAKDAHEGSSSPLRRLQQLLLLTDSAPSDCSANNSPRLNSTATDSLRSYIADILFQELLSRPFYSDFSLSGAHQQQQQYVEGDDGIGLLLLEPAVKYMHQVSEAKLTGSLFATPVTASYVEALARRLCLFAEKVSDAVTSSGERHRRDQGFQLLSITADTETSTGTSERTKPIARSAASALQTRALTGVCNAITIWLQHTFARDDIEDTAGVIGSSQTNALYELLYPQLTDSVMADWDHYSLHRGAITLLGGLFVSVYGSSGRCRPCAYLQSPSISSIPSDTKKNTPKRRFGGRVVSSTADRSASQQPTKADNQVPTSTSVRNGIIESQFLWSTLSAPHLWDITTDWSECTSKQRSIRAANVMVICDVLECVSGLVARELQMSMLLSAHLAALKYNNDTLEVTVIEDRSKQLKQFVQLSTRSAKRLIILWMFPMIEKAALQLPMGIGESLGGASAATAALVREIRAKAARCISGPLGALGRLVAQQSAVLAVASVTAPQSATAGIVAVGSGNTDARHEQARVTARVILDQNALLVDESARLLASPSPINRQMAFRFMAATIDTASKSVLSMFTSSVREPVHGVEESAQLIEEFADLSDGKFELRDTTPAFLSRPWCQQSVTNAKDVNALAYMLSQMIRLCRETIEESITVLGGSGAQVYERDLLKCLEVATKAARDVTTLSIRAVFHQCFQFLNGNEADHSAKRHLDYAAHVTLHGNSSPAEATKEDGGKTDPITELLLNVANPQEYSDILKMAGDSHQGQSAPIPNESTPLYPSITIQERLAEVLTATSALYNEAGEGGDANRDELRCSVVAQRELLKVLSASIPSWQPLGPSDDSVDIITAGQLIASLQETVAIVYELQMQALLAMRVIGMHSGMVIGRGGEAAVANHNGSQASALVSHQVSPNFSNVYPILEILKNSLFCTGSTPTVEFVKSVTPTTSSKLVFDILSTKVTKWLPLPSQQWSTLHQLYGAVQPLLITPCGFGMSLESILAEGSRLTEQIIQRQSRKSKNAVQLLNVRQKQAAKIAVEEVKNDQATAVLELVEQLHETEEDSDGFPIIIKKNATSSPKMNNNVSLNPSHLTDYPWPQWLRTIDIDSHHAEVIDFMTVLYQAAPNFMEARMLDEVAPLLLRVWFRRVQYSARVKGVREHAILAAIGRFISVMMAEGEEDHVRGTGANRKKVSALERLMSEVGYGS